MLLLLLLSTDNENIGGSDFDLSLYFLSPSFLLFSRVPSCLYLYWLRNYGSQLLSNPTHQMISKCNPIKRLLRHFSKHFLKFLSIPLAESIPTLMTHRISYGHGWPTAWLYLHRIIIIIFSMGISYYIPNFQSNNLVFAIGFIKNVFEPYCSRPVIDPMFKSTLSHHQGMKDRQCSH